jgi:aspartate-semialdehyde dehydrogenase
VSGPRLAVVGATGAVGSEMTRILEERAFPLDELVLYATERSAGSRVSFRGDDLEVHATGDAWFEGIDIALVSCGGAASRELLPAAADAGTVCIDNSSAFRMDPAVPLVIPEVNADAARGHQGIIANPNCTAITALVPLAPLHSAFGLRFLLTSSYQSVSGTGRKAIRELAEQVGKLHGQEEELRHPDPAVLPVPEVYARPIAYNVIPLCEVPDPAGSGFTTEETKMAAETRKILGLPDLYAAATAVRVPVVVGHGVSVYAEFDLDATVAAARAALAEAPGVRLMDALEEGAFPTPLDAAGIDDVLVGRIRRPEVDRAALLYFACADNLRKGAALNAVQIAELLTA